MTEDAPTAEATGPPELPKCPVCAAPGTAIQRQTASRVGCSNKECAIHVQAKTLDEAVAGWAAIAAYVPAVRLLLEIDKFRNGESKNIATDSAAFLAVQTYVKSIGVQDAPETDS